MAKKRKTSLGSGRIYHARGARVAYKDAMTTFDRTIQDANKGNCWKALEKFAVANSDMGVFHRELRHAVGPGARGAMDAPRMKQQLHNKRLDAMMLLQHSCLRK